MQRLQGTGFIPTVLLFVLLLVTASANAAIWYVDGSKQTSGVGDSWLTAFNNLPDAVTAAAPNDEIWVRAGTYKRSDPAESFELKNGVKIFGGFAGTETELHERDIDANPTILSGDLGSAGNSYHVVKAVGRLDFPDTVLDGFTIRDGAASGGGADSQGGGIYIQSTDIGLTNACSPIIAR